MADRKHIGKRNGPKQTNWATPEPGFFLAPDYKLVPFNQTRVTATGQHKVLAVVPIVEDSGAARFLGRWDPVDKSLDFDFVDGHGRVLPGKRSKRPMPHGHHPTDLGGQRFAVELGPEASRIIFTGIVAVSLGFEITPATGSFTTTGNPAGLIHAKPATPGATDSII